MGPRGSGEDLIACATCGVYLPRQRALTELSGAFCSAECRDHVPEKPSNDPDRTTDAHRPESNRETGTQ